MTEKSIDKAKHIVMHQTDDYPAGLRSAKEISSQLQGITEERINDLADSGYLPCFRIDNGPPLFKISEVKKWIAKNLISRSEGMSLPSRIRIVSEAPPVFEKPPKSIRNITELRQIQTLEVTPGVYFLCHGDEVVYVGQSVNPMGRVATHVDEGLKTFDRVYLLPTPKHELNDVEAAFIRTLRPRQQGGLRSGAKNPVAPFSSRAPRDVISELCE